MLNSIDIHVLYFINKACSNTFLDYFSLFVTELGSGEILFAVAAILILFKNRKMRMAGVLILAGLTISYHVVGLLKGWVGRPRPFIMLPDLNRLYPEKGFSFPSGHSALAFMAASILSSFFRKYVVFFALATMVALSRIYIGAHYLTDVAAGAVVGMIIGYSLVLVARQIDPELGR